MVINSVTVPLSAIFMASEIFPQPLHPPSCPHTVNSRKPSQPLHPPYMIHNKHSTKIFITAILLLMCRVASFHVKYITIYIGCCTFTDV